MREGKRGALYRFSPCLHQPTTKATKKTHRQHGLQAREELVVPGHVRGCVEAQADEGPAALDGEGGEGGEARGEASEDRQVLGVEEEGGGALLFGVLVGLVCWSVSE